MYAIVRTGGKQYQVACGDQVRVEPVLDIYTDDETLNPGYELEAHPQIQPEVKSNDGLISLKQDGTYWKILKEMR